MDKVSLIFLLINFGCVFGGVFEECLRKDSISCLQMEVFRSAKSFFDNSNVEVVGISLGARKGKSFTERVELEKKVATAGDVLKRQKAIEDYVIKQIRNLWKDLRISWNIQETARSLSNFGGDVEMNNINGEARGKAKKQLQILLPLLIGIKFKLATLAAITYMIIAVIAKKAVLAGLISLLISGFMAVKNIMETKHAPQAAPYYAAYDPAASGLWGRTAIYEHDLTGAHQHQQLAYAVKPTEKTQQKR